MGELTASRHPAAAPAPALSRPLLLAQIVLIALNLRPALAGVGPLVDDIRADTGLTNAALGLLTTLPLLAFGVVSTFTSVVTQRWGVERTLAGALLLIAVGTAARWGGGAASLFIGTVLFGVGIALGNVLLPTLVKRDFPRRSGAMTGMYSSVMGLGATLGAGLSVPISRSLAWRGALGAWTVAAIVALLVWLPNLRRRNAVPPLNGVTMAQYWRSPVAWQIALFMGLQSLTFYVVLAWLPDLLQSRGMPAAEAGWMLALSQAVGILGSAAVPVWAGRLHDQRRSVLLLAASETVALLGLLRVIPGPVALWVALLGIVLGGTFALSLLLIVLRSADVEGSTALSGMAQSVGYLVAAAGPAMFGLLRDATGGWTVPLLSLFVVLAGKVLSGLGAGRRGATVGAVASGTAR